MEKISVAIITLNEEQNIERCLKSITFADEIIIVDSFSSDRTVEIAKKYHAKVFQEEFLGYGEQKNYAFSLCSCPWILSVDADEELSTELISSIKFILSQNYLNQDDLYFIKRRTSFCKKFIYHGGWYPDILGRLGKRNKVYWTTPNVHEELKVIGHQSKSLNILDGHLNHYSFETYLSQVQTNVKYAKLGAKSLAEKKGRPSFFSTLIRPFFKFLECYFLKMGILDGKEGLIIAINASYSQFMKYSMAYWNDQ